MNKENALVVFEDKKIRRLWHNGAWWFVLEDIIIALTDSNDPKSYVTKMKARDLSLAEGWGQIVTPLSIMTVGGLQNKNCASVKGLFRIIQSISSPKAEPFKRWLAQVGYERVQEIENPELGQDRLKEYYELKGYPKEWVDKRIRGIAIRQELTDEWKNREIKENKDFAILTNEITKATFNKTVDEYKQFKGLPNKKNANLRDHMTDWELILTMVGEKATTDITKVKNAKGLEQCQDSAKRGGTVAHITKQNIENEIGKSVISTENYLDLQRKKQKQLEEN